MTKLAVSCLLMLLSSSSILASNRFSFDAFEIFPVDAPVNICSADLNGDGIADLATNGPCISILFGIGNGTFRTMVRYVPDPARDEYQSLVVADFNKDGATDLSMVSHDYPPMLVIALNDGSGGFEPGILIAPTAYAGGPQSLALSDFNGDGNEDVALLYRDSTPDFVSIFLGNGDGTFQPEIVTAIPTDYTSLKNICAADFNGDGDADVAFADSYSLSLIVLLGRGDGTFRTGPVCSDLPETPGVMSVADVDLDGDWDIATNGNDYYESDYYFYVLLNAGDGGFDDLYTSPPQSYLYGDPKGIFASDLDGDGDADMVVLHWYHVTLFENDGAGVYALIGGYETNMDPRACVGDFDRDGDSDIAYASSNNDATILLNNGDTTFRDADYYLKSEITALSSADFNRDGKPDLAASTFYGKLAIYLGDGEGALQETANYVSSPEAQWVDIADYNADAFADIAISNGYQNTVSILLGNGDGTLRPKTDYAAGGVAVQICSADLDGDGAVDLAAANVAPSQISVLFGNGDGTFRAPVAYASPADLPQPYSICAADFDGDGDADLAVGAYETTWRAISLGVFMNNGDGTFQSPALYHSTRTRRVIASDVDHDGDVDIVALHSEGIAIHLNNGYGTFSVLAEYALGYADSFCLSDFNLDGKLDIAACGGFSYTVWVNGLHLLAGNGDGSFTPQQTFFGLGHGRLVAGDLENDGDPDLIIADSYRIMVTHNLASVATAIGGEAAMPALPFLSQNFPNPFNPSTTFRVSLSTPGHARIVAYDSAGRLVAVIADRYFPAGVSEIVWHGRDERGEALASGVYFARMTMNGRALAKKVLLLR